MGEHQIEDAVALEVADGHVLVESAAVGARQVQLGVAVGVVGPAGGRAAVPLVHVHGGGRGKRGERGHHHDLVRAVSVEVGGGQGAQLAVALDLDGESGDWRPVRLPHVDRAGAVRGHHLVVALALHLRQHPAGPRPGGHRALPQHLALQGIGRDLLVLRRDHVQVAVAVRVQQLVGAADPAVAAEGGAELRLGEGARGRLVRLARARAGEVLLGAGVVVVARVGVVVVARAAVVVVTGLGVVVVRGCVVVEVRRVGLVGVVAGAHHQQQGGEAERDRGSQACHSSGITPTGVGIGCGSSRRYSCPYMR